MNIITKEPVKNRKRLIGWLKILLAVSVLIILIFWIRPEELIKSLLGANPRMLILALVLLVPNVLFQGIRWAYLLRRQTPGVPLKEILASLFLGWTLGIPTPGGVGQFARAFAVPSAPTLPTIGLTFVDKLFTLVWIVLAGAAGIFSFHIVPTFIVWICLPVALFIVWLAFSPQLLNRILQALCRRLPFRDILRKIISVLDHLNTRDCLIAHIWSLLLVVTFLSQFVILVAAFLPLEYLDGLRAAAAVVFIKTVLPLTFNGLGFGEWLSTNFFGLFGVPKAAAFNASILLFSINLVIPSLVGLFFLPALKLSKKEKVGNQP